MKSSSHDRAVVIDGLTYIPIKDAAAGSHLSTEYLARSGRIRGRVVAHIWFIEIHSLQQFLSVNASSK